MDPGKLYEQPFIYISAKGIDGVFSDQDAAAILGIVGQINQNAEAAPD